jgi:hypothetical protein
MKNRSRILAVVIIGFCAISSIVGYNAYSAFYNHIMEPSEVSQFRVEPVQGTHPLQLRILVETNQSAPVIRAITTKESGTSVTVLYHLALAGLAKPKLSWGHAYLLEVPDSVTDVQFGRHPKVIWHRLKHSRALRLEEVEQTLQSNLTVVRSTGQVPEAVKEDYSDLTGEQFDMANPGEPMNDDVIEPGIPNRRLVLVGLGSDRDVLVYQNGGFVSTLNVIVVIHGVWGGAWGARFEDYSIDNVSGLNAAIHESKFTTWRDIE